MKIAVQKDLSYFLEDVARINGIDIGKYANSLIEKGLRQDLADSGYCKKSIDSFMQHLASEKFSDWALLSPTRPI